MLIHRHGNEVEITITRIDDPAVSIIRNAPQPGKRVGARWRCEATARTLEYLRDKGAWTQEARQLLADLDQLKMYSADAPKPETLDFAFKTKPYDFQLPIFKRSRDRTAYGYFMEQGTGKTKVTIDKAAYHYSRGDISGMIIFAFPDGVHRNWVLEELPTHMPDWVKWRACVWSSKRSTAKRWLREHVEPLLNPERGTLSIMAVSSESLMSPRLVNVLGDFIERHDGRVFFVFDESTAFSKPGNKRVKIAMKLLKAAANRYNKVPRVIMTGTPNPRDPLQLYSQFNLIDQSILGFESFTSFRSRYATMAPVWGKKDRWGRQIMSVSGYKDLDKLKALIEPHMSRVLKEDVLDLPEKTYKRIIVEMTPKQERVYLQMEDEMKAELGGATITAPMAMTRLMRLHQICNNLFEDKTTGVKSVIEEGTHPRLRSAIDRITTYPGKALIWASFTTSLRELYRALDEDDKGCAIPYWGEIEDKDREEGLLRWRREPRCKYIVAHPRALGYGHTLTEAANTMFYANGHSLELRLQAEDRNHRIGQRHSVNYDDVTTADTIEGKIIDALRAKRELSAEITGDKLREWI